MLLRDFTHKTGRLNITCGGARSFILRSRVVAAARCECFPRPPASSALGRATDHRQRGNLGKLFKFIGATIGSYAGWYLGAMMSTMMGFFLMIIGLAVGTYLGIKAAKQYEV